MIGLPDFSDIERARSVLTGHAVHTPLLENNILNDFLGGRVFMKAEMLQKTGSFKFRGAFNAVSQLEKDKFPGGIVACSSGNHAQGVAEAARLLGVRALILMPKDAPEIKVKRTRRSGAEVAFFDREKDDRDKVALDYANERHAAIISPFDNPYVIAGQGTAGLEIAESLKKQGILPDYVLTPCSGGGLTGGTALVVKHFFPHAQVYCVEPEGFDDYRRSLESGHHERNAKSAGSICDSLLIQQPGKITFEVNKTLLSGGLVVDDMAVRRAMKFAFEELKLIVEPGGAITLAALLEKKISLSGKTAAIILSGGNVDQKAFTTLIDV